MRGVFFGQGQFRAEASSVGNSVYVAGGSADVAVHDNTLVGSVRDGIVCNDNRWPVYRQERGA